METVLQKRKKSGGGANWGSGWDDLFSQYWDDVEKIYEDGLNGQHDEMLINKVFQAMEEILKNKTLPRIERYCQAINEDSTDWLNGATNVLNNFQTAETLNDKVIAINIAEQFLRAADPNSQKIKEVLGDNA